MNNSPDGALRLPNHGARESVIKSLQAKASRTNPGTEEHDQADLAISLALSAGRSALLAPYLMRNVQRDARHILNNQRKEVPFSVLENLAAPASADGIEPKKLDDLLPPSRHPRPDEVAVANELEEKVRTAVRPLTNGEACLDAMLEHELTNDTAARLAVPPHQVHRTREYIRRHAQRVLA